ncbi:MAG: SCO family protein [Acidiferrobacterales bacterium]
MKKLIIGIVIAAMLGAGVYLGLVMKSDDPLQLLTQDSVITILPTPKVLSEFSLRDQDGKVFDPSRLRGKWSLLFFGFTNCPDICPTTLTILNQVHQHLGKKPALLVDVQFVFISVDPGRDDFATLKKYVSYFNKDFIGVTGSKEQLAKLTKQLGVFYEVLNQGGKKNYAVNHTAAIFIINKDAGYFGIMSPPLNASAMAARIELIQKL